MTFSTWPTSWARRCLHCGLRTHCDQLRASLVRTSQGSSLLTAIGVVGMVTVTVLDGIPRECWGDPELILLVLDFTDVTSFSLDGADA